MREKGIKEIYLDYAASTPVREEVQKAMQPYFSKEFGNPGSSHCSGQRAKEAVDAARKSVAHLLAAQPEEIIFTGSATESVNLAIKGLARAYKSKGKHIITSKIEHEAVLSTCKYLEKEEDFSVTYLAVDTYGRVSPAEFRKAIRKDTIFASIMYANNEIGTIQPISELAAIAHERSVFFHTDACQAGGALSIDVQNLGVDLLTLNGSKIYGPKGVGVLYLKSGIHLHPLIHGGGQEFGLRSGTLNVPAIIGFATALELAQKECIQENKRLISLRDLLITLLHKKIKGISLNGHPQERLPNNVNIAIDGVDGETVLSYLDMAGICASSGSACSAASKEQSHVLSALGTVNESQAIIRFTLGKETTKEELKKVADILTEIVASLRKINTLKKSNAGISRREFMA